MMRNYFKITALMGSLLLAGCASTGSSAIDDTSHINTTSLSTLKNLKTGHTVVGKHISKIRAKAIKDTALTLGAQGGLAWRAKHLNEITKENSSSLNQVFNFQELILDHHVLPPILVEADQSLNLSNDRTIRLSGKIYKIIQQARFVTAAPNWRQYLLLDYQKPSVPDATLLPKNSEERQLWVHYINQGWQEGVQQANNIYMDNLARLKRDYKGMLLYTKLAAQHIVSKPYVAKSDLGVTSNKSHSKLYVNDRILRITALPELNSNTKQWKTVVETNDGSDKNHNKK